MSPRPSPCDGFSGTLTQPIVADGFVIDNKTVLFVKVLSPLMERQISQAIAVVRAGAFPTVDVRNTQKAK